MRKIYSLVLMATMLLVGTNVWAFADTNLIDDPTGQDASIENGTGKKYGSINNVFNAVAVGETVTIKLLKDNVTPTGPIVIYSNTDGTGNPKQITLDMNGKNITYSGENAGLGSTPLRCLFFILKGHLKITNSTNTASKIETTWIMSGNGSGDASVPFMLAGSSDRGVSNQTNLTIEKGVKVIGKYAGIQIQGFSTWDKVNSLANITYTADYGSGTSRDQHAAYGVNVSVNDSVRADLYGIQISGTISASPKPESNGGTSADYPYPSIMILDSGKVEAANEARTWFKNYGQTGEKQPVGAYASGYAIWKIRGQVKGANALFVKMGDITVEGNAQIISTAATNKENSASGTNESGVRGSGNGVTLSNDWAYGTMSITFTGDPVIQGSGTNGVAVKDSKESSQHDNQITNIKIEGGDFQGAIEGAAVEISDSFEGSLEVTGGSYTGSIETLVEALADDTTTIIRSTVEDPQTGKVTVVVGEVSGTETVEIVDQEDEITDFAFTADMSDQIVQLVAKKKPISKDLGTLDKSTVKYLSLNGKNADTLCVVTVGANKTLEVGQVVMNQFGRIVVEAGGKLLITDKNGIFAAEVDNLILKADENHTALFVMSPTVKTNKQPKATVQIYAKDAYQENSTTWNWQRIAMPLSSFESVASIYTGSYPPSDDHLRTWGEYWNSETRAWESIPGGWAGMNAFKGYAITNNATASDRATYVVKGNMQGVVDGSVHFNQAGWNFFGNSYTAPMHLRTLLRSIMQEPNADGTMHFFDPQNQSYTDVNEMLYNLNWPGLPTEVKPFETWVMCLNHGNSATASADYSTSVWDYNTLSSSDFNTQHPMSAPQRVSSPNSVVCISVSDNNGLMDNVVLVESNNYSAEYENGADSYKMMNAGLNIYATEGDAYSIIATDDIVGTMITLSTNDEITYTLSFNNVRGEIYALRDNITNAVVLMNEGATYNFTAQSNATLDGRFQIVSRQEMPTAVETVEEKVNASKAVYTIMGQYVGETTDWNNLPAGVYVVDGVKVIK